MTTNEPGRSVAQTAHALYHVENRRPEAIALLEAAAAQSPTDEETLNALAFIYATEGRYVDAIRLFHRLVDLNPAPRYMRNIYHCRTAAADCILDGRPVNGAAA